MISRHTKFAPDWCFGLLKQRYRRSEVSTLADIADVVNSSTVVGINHAEIVGRENGQVNVPTFDWQMYFHTFCRPFPGIKAVHHFRFQLIFQASFSIKLLPHLRRSPFKC